MQFRLLLLISLVLNLVSVFPAHAQNITNYPSLPDPILLLLREPAVLKELNLKSEQRRKITQLNHSQDGMLLAIRNKPLEQQSEQYARQISQTRQLINETLSADKLHRIQQIQIRIRGYRSLLEPSIAERLTLTDDQQHSLQGLFTALDDEFEQLRQNTSDPEKRATGLKRVQALQQDTQRKALEILSQTQQQQFAALVGKRFDVAQLGHVQFQAPDFPANANWVNSSPLKLADLRGKVTALHFWAYG